ncbi:MAG: FHA domain-containing protein, partial [Burkholderiales bacterium]
TTGETVAALSPQMRETVRRLDALPVKGKVEEIEVHELLWQTTSERTVIPGRAAPAPAPAGGPRIRLVQRGKELTFKDTFYFGREAAGNHVVVASPMISRRHAKIELRGGKFVLVDQSSNGTFLTLGNNAEMKLRREEAILYGSGVIALGQSAAAAGEDAIEFHCG